jgi:hypothetical protein
MAVLKHAAIALLQDVLQSTAVAPQGCAPIDNSSTQGCAHIATPKAMLTMTAAALKAVLKPAAMEHAAMALFKHGAMTVLKHPSLALTELWQYSSTQSWRYSRMCSNQQQ